MTFPGHTHFLFRMLSVNAVFPGHSHFLFALFLLRKREQVT